jgi:hypothetical protein
VAVKQQENAVAQKQMTELVDKDTKKQETHEKRSD